MLDFRVPPQGKDKKKSLKLISPTNFTNHKKPHNTSKRKKLADDIKSMLNPSIILLSVIVPLPNQRRKRHRFFGKSCKMKLILESWLYRSIQNLIKALRAESEKQKIC